MEAVGDFVVWLQGLPPLGIYAVLFAVAYGENLVPPIWGDTVIVLCGSFVGLGVVGFVPTVALATLGGALGFMSVFVIGRRLGDAIHDPTRLRWIPRAPVAKAERWIERWGYGVIAANRFLAGGRSVIGLLAGASTMRWAPSALWSSLSAFVWSALLVWGGAVLGAEWTRVLEWLATYGRVVTVVLGLIAAVAILRWYRRRRTNPPRREG